MDRLFKVLLIYCSLSSVIYLQSKLGRRSGERRERDRTSSEYQVALQLQREWNNIGNFSRQTKIIIHSNWRSGSSFLGGIFESSKDVMYIYEPFQDLGSRVVRKAKTDQHNKLSDGDKLSEILHWTARMMKQPEN